MNFWFNGFANKCKTSAAIKYYKMGFRAESERNNREILEEITRGGNGIFIDTCALGKFERDMFGATQMSLSEDAIKKYLEGI